MPKPSRVSGRESPAASGDRDRSFGDSGASLETTQGPSRRRFSAADKLRIVQEADACLASGERGALGKLLRREGLYSSQLASWRTQLGAGGAAGLTPRKPGRKPRFDAKDLENQRLTKRVAQIERQLHIANALIDLQKKAHAILGIALPTFDEAS